MSFSLLTVVQQSDGAINTLGYFDAAFAVQAAQGLRNSIVNVAFKVNNGNALCSATASVDPGATTVACPVTMGHPPNTQCVVAQCRNTPDSVPRGSQFYLIMDWGVCRSDTPAVTCRQWSENVLVSFNRLSSVQSSTVSVVPTSTTAAVGADKSSSVPTGDGNSNSGQQQQQPQKGVAQDNSVAITVPIVSVVAIAAGVFLFIKYRNLHRAKKRLQQTDLAAVFQSLNTAPSTSKPMLPSNNARSNQSIMSAAPLIKGGTSVHSSSVSARSNATLEQTPAYLDDESDAGIVSSMGAIDHVQFGQTAAGVTPSVYQSTNPSPFGIHTFSLLSKLCHSKKQNSKLRVPSTRVYCYYYSRCKNCATATAISRLLRSAWKLLLFCHTTARSCSWPGNTLPRCATGVCLVVCCCWTSGGATCSCAIDSVATESGDFVKSKIA
ncbi:hypothetical protein BJ741DRAFT_603623 [Chytriomyces cf. hyalinus JEL632]|nr:hypothetical protein BJ741DRAFT_603623 [Chytriomyces cf. hyalinus JEL632]